MIITGHEKSKLATELQLIDIYYIDVRYSNSYSSNGYLICIELSFLAESWRHVLGLYLLLGHVVLVLVEEMLVLNLYRDTWAQRTMRRRQAGGMKQRKYLFKI